MCTMRDLLSLHLSEEEFSAYNEKEMAWMQSLDDLTERFRKIGATYTELLLFRNKQLRRMGLPMERSIDLPQAVQFSLN
jgi:hypothetical protein